MKKNGIGVLTGGGDCPGLNAALRGITKAAIGLYGMRVVGFEDGFEGLITGRHRKLTYEDVSGILTRGGTILGTSNRADPFGYWTGSGRKRKKRDVSAKAIANFRALRLLCLVCIGGDGTLSIAKRLHDRGLPCIGIPKTIDNDLSGTDVTFGFYSAVSIAMGAIDMIHTTAESHHRVMVVEVMGRYAGWLALFAGIAGGGDVILIPEIPYDIGAVCRKLKERHRRGKRFSIVVVAEGAKPQGGRTVVKKMIAESPDPVRLGGVGAVLARAIEERAGLETRVTVLGHLQRGGSPTAFDRILATRFGTEAARLAAEGKFGLMVGIRGARIVSVPLSRAVAKLKHVPRNHPLIGAAAAVGTSFGV